MSDLHGVPEQHGLLIGDLVVCLLGAFALAFAAWAIVLGIFAGTHYVLTRFQITLPDLASSGLNLGGRIIPALAGLLTGVLGYRFLARLP